MTEKTKEQMIRDGGVKFGYIPEELDGIILPKEKKYIACDSCDFKQRAEFDTWEELMEVVFVKNKDISRGAWKSWREFEGFAGFCVKTEEGADHSTLQVQFKSDFPDHFHLITIARIYPADATLGAEDPLNSSSRRYLQCQ